jgi:hypothetical protein
MKLSSCSKTNFVCDLLGDCNHNPTYLRNNNKQTMSLEKIVAAADLECTGSELPESTFDNQKIEI